LEGWDLRSAVDVPTARPVRDALCELEAAGLAVRHAPDDPPRWLATDPPRDDALAALKLRGPHDLRHTFSTWLEGGRDRAPVGGCCPGQPVARGRSPTRTATRVPIASQAVEHSVFPPVRKHAGGACEMLDLLVRTSSTTSRPACRRPPQAAAATGGPSSLTIRFGHLWIGSSESIRNGGGPHD
jgi:hypothetical protein